jgi:Uma2 family endonuclease
MSMWLGTYGIATPGVGIADNATVILDELNEVQPDLLARIEPDAGGRSRITADGYVDGPPELIIEIASSSASYDLHMKRDVYAAAGVQEYIVWRTLDHAIDWWALDDRAGGRRGQRGQRDGDRYRSLSIDAGGLVQSQVLPGLVLDIGAMLDGEVEHAMDRQRSGLDSSAHRMFVARLTGG